MRSVFWRELSAVHTCTQITSNVLLVPTFCGILPGTTPTKIHKEYEADCVLCETAMQAERSCMAHSLVTIHLNLISMDVSRNHQKVLHFESVLTFSFFFPPPLE